MPTVPEDPQSADRRALLRQALEAVENLKAKVRSLESSAAEPIAIVGAGCRFPGGAHSLDLYWDLLAEGRDAVTEIPQSRWKAFGQPDAGPGWHAGLVEDLDQFEPKFFGISAREASLMDPQQRLVLEVAWQALENAGQNPKGLDGSRTGVYIGVTGHDYGDLLREAGGLLDIYAGTGNANNAVAGRLSFLLGLQGPCFSVDTACSSSLVAIHLASQGLRNRECSMALAGGVNVVLTSGSFECIRNWGVMSPDGRCKTFDAGANGFVRAEGCGIIVLKRLSDAVASRDNILALIRGSAVNQDGRSSGLTVPNGPAQEEVIRQALASARVKPEQITYVEAHGTGTPIGDPIEAHAIGAVLGAGRSDDNPLIVGAVKTNLGHLESASGVAGLLKIALAMREKRIPANLHFHELSPNVDWAGVPVEVPVQSRPWPSAPRLAGVSAFGFSGTNAHVILEEAPPVVAHSVERDRPVHLLALSARTPKALAQLERDFGHRRFSDPVADICFTANTGRAHFGERLVVTGSSTEGIQSKLAASIANRGQVGRSAPKIAFLFTGQGSQYPGMGRELFDTQPEFRASLETCAAILMPYMAEPLLEVLYGQRTHLLHETAYTQPALFALEWALAKLWRSWGIEPSFVLGHSVGEYVAACVAGYFSLDDGLKLIAARAKLMQALGPGWGMLAAQCAPEALKRISYPSVSVAAYNGPESITISGQLAELALAEAELTRQGITVKSLPVSHGFHSAQMDSILGEFREIAGTIRWETPGVSLISSVTGKLSPVDELQDPNYWARQVRDPVRFHDAVTTAAERGCNVFLEIGPSPVLTGLGRRVVGKGDHTWAFSLRPDKDWEQMLEALSQLYLRGADVDWAAYDAPYSRRRVALPTYPFDRQRYWMDAAKESVRTKDGVGSFCRKQLESPALPGPVYEFELAASHPTLAGHRLNGTIVFPFTGYLQLARECDIAGLADFRVDKALLLEEGERRKVQVTVDDSGIRFFSHANGNWITHATGRIAVVSNLAAEDLRTLRGRIDEPVLLDGFLDRMRKSGLDYGEPYHGLLALWECGDESLGMVRGAAELAPVLDACLQVLTPLVERHAGGAVLPAGADSIEITGSLAGPVWAHGCITSITSDGITADIKVYRESGDQVASITRFQAKRLATRARTLLYEIAWHQAEREPQNSQAEGWWLLIGGGADAEGLAASLRLSGGSVVAIAQQGIAAEILDSHEWRGIIYLANLEIIPGMDVELAAKTSLSPVYALIQTLAKQAQCPKVWLVTECAIPIGDDPVEPVQACLWGLGRSLAAEYPQYRISLMDIDAEADFGLVAGEFPGESAETRVAIRGGKRWVARLRPWREGGPSRLTISAPGVLDNLISVPIERREPGAGDVEIRVLASGLNFRDVLSALGMVPGMEGVFGAECSGIVERVGSAVQNLRIGDAVVAFAPASFATHVTVRSEMVALKPENLTFAQASALPVAYFTCMYGLEMLAQLKRGETILIHAGAGGVGLAAIEVARRIGAKIFATGGSEEKRQHLRDLGIEFVFDSRSREFARQVLDSTDGRGVDIVLNSLAGDLIDAGFEALAPAGRFVELGKRGIWTDEEVAAARPDAKYFAFDFGERAWNNPSMVRELFVELNRRLDAGEMHPLPVQVFDQPDAASAFRMMAQARHTGKLVVAQSGRALSRHAQIVSEGQYLITGGLGALGLQTAAWLVKMGARSIVLAGRKDPTAAVRESIDELRRSGAMVEVHATDVADFGAVEALLAKIRHSRKPLRGVFHAAGVLDDGIAADQTWDRAWSVMAPKVAGAANLHRLTQHDPLDFFVLFSSASAILGSPGQTSYGAGNAYLDGLAHARRKAGLPALSVNWGGWASSGMAAALSDRQRARMRDAGMEPIRPADAFAALDLALTATPPQLAAILVDWEVIARQGHSAGSDAMFFSEVLHPGGAKQPGLLSASAALQTAVKTGSVQDRGKAAVKYLQSIMASIAGFAESEVNPAQPVTDFGLDSLMALEFKNRIQTDTGVSLPIARLLEGKSIAELAAELVAGIEIGAGPAKPATGEQLLLQVDSLSETELDAALSRMLAEDQSR